VFEGGEAMTELRKAAKRLLEALEDGWVQRDDWVAFALRQAIEEAEQWDTSDMAHRSGGLSVEQKPVAWDDDAWGKAAQEMSGDFVKRVKANWESAPKRDWVGLTDEEIDYIWGISPGDYEDKFAFPRAIEAKLKERNT
jgi:hypothetical protein